MKQESIDKLYEILDKMPIKEYNREEIDKIRELLDEGEFLIALDKMKNLNQVGETKKEKSSATTKMNKKMRQIKENKEDEEQQEGTYPEELSNSELEEDYIGLLLADPKLITKYYVLFENCLFKDNDL